MGISKRLYTLAVAIALVLLLAGGIVLLAGCDFPSSQPTAGPGVATDTPVPSQPTPVPTAEADGTPVPSIITLTIWTTESFSPTETFTGGLVLAQQVAEFEAAHPDVQLEFVLKKPHGKAGILDYLLTTQSAVPDLLPDLTIVDIDELKTVVEAGLAQPLDDLVPADLVADLYPAAKASSTVNDQLHGLQFQADLEHLVYNTGKMTVPPSSWPGVLSNPGPYAFPAGGQAGFVNDAFWIQYLAVQPFSVEDTPDSLPLDQDSLAAVLQYYQDGVSRGIFPAEVLDFNTTDDCWQTFMAGDSSLTHVDAHRYLLERENLQGAAPAPIPAINGPAAAINHGWALVLVSADPIRQSLVTELLLSLMSPETNAAWNQAAGYLPTRQAALALWDQEDSYVPFAEQQLQAVQPRPKIENYAQVAGALQNAVVSVLTGDATPEDAASQVVESTQ